MHTLMLSLALRLPLAAANPESDVRSFCAAQMARRNADLAQNFEAAAILRGMLKIDPDAHLTVLTDPPLLVKARPEEDLKLTVHGYLRDVPAGGHVYLAFTEVNTALLKRVREALQHLGHEFRYVTVAPLGRRGYALRMPDDAPGPF